jgi:hypothetical protein
MLKRTIALSAGLLTLIVAADANAFWYARGWRGGVAVGGFRPPAVVAPYYLNGCLRCAPYYHPAIAAALAARAGVAAGVAAGAAAAPPPAAAPAPAAPSSSAAAAAPSDQDGDENAASSSGNGGGQQTAAAPSASTSPSSAASSGKGKASTCAAGLSKDAKAIYDATAPQVGSLSTLRETVVAQTRSLVMAGKIGQGTAKSSAQAAGECLALLAHN